MGNQNTSVAGSTIFKPSGSVSSTQKAKTITLKQKSLKSGTTATITSATLVKAVYGHIQAVRTLGRTTINTVDIARALGVSPAMVKGTLSQLKNKGVKIAK